MNNPQCEINFFKKVKEFEKKKLETLKPLDWFEQIMISTIAIDSHTWTVRPHESQTWKVYIWEKPRERVKVKLV